MAKFVKVQRRSGPGCCPCDIQTGCACNDDNCSLSCRAKASTASLCGFSEFEFPSSPPKKYRRKTVGRALLPAAPFFVCGPVPECRTDCRRDVTFDYHAIVPGIGDVHSVGTFSYVDTVAGLARYMAHALGTAINFSEEAETAIFVNGPNVRLHEGEIISLPLNTIVTVGLQYNYITWNEPVAGCVRTGADEWYPYADEWSIVSSFNATTCLQNSDVNTSYSKTLPECEGSGGTLNPTRTAGMIVAETFYGSGVTLDPAGPALLQINGVGCLNNGDGTFTKYNGRLNVSLDDEDTEQDAINRANALIGDWTAGACDTTTTFITLRGPSTFVFGYRTVQTRATCGDITNPLIPGHTYKLTIHYTWRVLGTGGPFTDYGIDEITFTAAHPIETTAWVDVPMEDAKEIKSSSCTLEDVTPP
jgi:hypothetical protein